MTTLIVGDVHGCSVELRRLVELAGAQRVILVGDIFTKGPDPAGVWEQIQQGSYEAVLGNHDARLLNAYRGDGKPDTRSEACIEALNRSSSRWHPWLCSLDLFLRVGEFLVVHAGIHPSGDMQRTSRAMALSMRRWPQESAEHPFWHEQYEGEQSVVFGHDARRGLIFKETDQNALLVGLDTGCVYGNQLSGFLVEERRVIHVQAKKAYCPI